MAARARLKSWHPEDIKAALVKRLGRLTLLSKRQGWHRATISMAIRHPRKAPAVSGWIAETLQQPVHVLWPDHYPPPGESRPRTVNAQHPSRRATPSHRQKGAAA